MERRRVDWKEGKGREGKGDLLPLGDDALEALVAAALALALGELGVVLPVEELAPAQEDAGDAHQAGDEAEGAGGGRVPEGPDLRVRGGDEERDEAVHEVVVEDDLLLALVHERLHEGREALGELLEDGPRADEGVGLAVLLELVRHHVHQLLQTTTNPSSYYGPLMSNEFCSTKALLAQQLCSNGANA